MTFHPVLASFVGNSAWFGVLLGLHVGGAIIGLGSTYAFPILGKMAESGGAAGLFALEAMDKIERAIVLPVLIVVQLGTGILLIFNRGLDRDFFGPHNSWLLAAIGIYVVLMGLSTGVDGPARRKSIAMAKAGKAGTPEFEKLIGLQKKLGPLFGLLGVSLIVLMVWKPGSGCGPLYRC